MNLVLYAIQNKKTKKIEHQGFFFTRDKRKEGMLKDEEHRKARFVTLVGFDPDKYTVYQAHFQTLRKFRRALYRAYLNRLGLFK